MLHDERGTLMHPLASMYLHPGQLFVSPEPAEIVTVLGSCVAVCLWDSSRKVGGVNHFLLPDWIGNGHSSPRFGNVATRELVAGLLQLGCRRQDLQAKVFGGACVIEAFRGRAEHLGVKNVEAARRALAAERVRVVGEEVGGARGRRLVFHTASGACRVRWI